jgi:hypothetical protein
MITPEKHARLWTENQTYPLPSNCEAAEIINPGDSVVFHYDRNGNLIKITEIDAKEIAFRGNRFTYKKPR